MVSDDSLHAFAMTYAANRVYIRQLAQPIFGILPVFVDIPQCENQVFEIACTRASFLSAN
jgi:hypothetical protein